jgi:hypothetical protein
MFYKVKFESFKIVKVCLKIKIKFLTRKFWYYNFILQPLFKSAQHFNEREGSGSVIMTNGSACKTGSGKKVPTCVLEVGVH